ncbi:MAG: SET domain-containing protein-lysine N-methyltransferase [Nanoarchaeota archaeon]|nr:SET domain-containing protein-lysine N-methyltransferase [Nanoarchaeota archaeon]
MEFRFEKKISKIHGQGIFAKDKIPTNIQFYKIPLDIVFNEPKSKCAKIATNQFVFDDKILNWINHSCNPNSELNLNKKEPVLISLKEILSGEEITVDYNLTEIGGKKTPCTCNAFNCKKYFKRL